MADTLSNSEVKNILGELPENFNKSKFSISYGVANNSLLKELQSLSKNQCLGKNAWPSIGKVNAWMISAETATFMKTGGLGMIASELPEAFNRSYNTLNEKMVIVTPLYLGDTKKKKASLKADVYCGSEGICINLKKIDTIDVIFAGKSSKLVSNKVIVYKGSFNNTDYIFLSNDRFFSINTSKKSPSSQQGCYVLNEYEVDEVERFAFFSKAVYTLLQEIFSSKINGLEKPNILVANDWHSGALSGLMKYLSIAKGHISEMSAGLVEDLKNLPIIHIAHHLGYQGWDYNNTSKILNSLYENVSNLVFRNAKPIKNSNPRSMNTLIVGDCYNQASCNFHLADRVVTVSKNYLEEVSKELKLGFDFRDILKMRKDHRNFFGIVNGYDKSLISPNIDKISSINKYFDGLDFKVFSSKETNVKLHNKKEFVKLISKLVSDEKYKKEKLPLLDLYKFKDILALVKKADKIPVVSATSRMVEQKGYDIAAEAILKTVGKKVDVDEYPIFILGGAGDDKYYEILKKLKDDITKSIPKLGDRIFVFRGYNDEFAYTIQLASDFYMMPSRFEPCGLTQMEAMAKGTIPIAMSTGGLVDTIEDGVDGFRTEVSFVDNRRVYGSNINAKRLKNNTNAYAETLEKALSVFYTDISKIEEMRIKDMENDFSWDVKGGALHKYYQLFHTGHI